MSKFYTFNQNNSGGSFEFNEEDGITHYVIIEANNVSHAIMLAKNIGIYFDGVSCGLDCPCCGDRWSDYLDEKDGKDEPEIFGDKVLAPDYVDTYTFMKKGKEFCVHYLDGTRVWG